MSPGDGQFQICENDAVVASGHITVLTDSETFDDECSTPVHYDTGALSLDADDIYKELRLRGYDYGPTFRGILSADGTGKPKWYSRLDSLTMITHSACIRFYFWCTSHFLTYLLLCQISALSKSHIFVNFFVLVLTLTSNRQYHRCL